MTTPEDTPRNITLTGSDPDGNALTFIIVTGPAHGMLSGGAPNVTYTPNSNYNGPDSFTFKVNDGSADSSVATVSINVTPVNDPPVANSQSVTTPEDTPRSITLTGSDVDGDSLTFTIVTGVAHGTLSGGGANVTYTPNANYNGPDSFTFKVNDGTADSNVATVSINVTPVNDPPVANAQSVTTPEDTPIGITLTGSDVDGDALSFTIVTGPAHGTLSGSGANVIYTPNANYNGPDSFTFKVNDGTVDSNVATVSIDVTPVNDAPVANPQSVITPEDTPIAITLTGSDVDGDPLTFAIVTGPAHGTLSGSGANVTYTPNANYNGPDSFTFRVNDGTVNSNIATVSIRVTPVNDPPVANPQTVSACASSSTPIVLTGSDPVEGSPVTFIIVTPPLHGTLSGTPPNVTYTPATFTTGDSFTFKVNDGESDSNIATVTLVDRTPPTISCPADVTVGSKCGAAGRVVGYPAPIAGDFCSRTVAVSCSNPSGSTFPNGMTTVTCTAVDLAGNSSSCSFHVTVRTPQFAIQALIDRVVAILGPQEAGSFVAKLEAALQSLEKDCHLTPAINQLEAFIREVDAQRGKKLTDAQADELIAAAQQIIAQLLQP
ncbi:MAG TPA: Ig-like domain-containing protein [Thermoanaerobaculia bacterium]